MKIDYLLYVLGNKLYIAICAICATLQASEQFYLHVAATAVLFIYISLLSYAAVPTGLGRLL